MIFTAGIYENIRIEKVEKTELGALRLTIKQVNENDNDSVLSIFTSNSDVIGDDGSGTLLEYPVSVMGFSGNVNEVSRIKEDLVIFKAKLNHILSQYMPVDNIIYRDNLTDLDITADNVNEKLIEQNIVTAMCDNYIESFIDMFEEANTDGLLRIKLVRTSKRKHYGKIPKSVFGYGGNSAFIETMDIPEDQSKLRFSDWEAKRGTHEDRDGFDYSDPTPFSEDNVAKEEATATDDLYGL